MFRRLHEPARPLAVFIDGTRIEVAEGDSVSTALLCMGVAALRKSSVSGSPRGIYCGMGVCFDCLVTIDGEGNRQACLTPVREGMRVVTGAGRRNLQGEAV